METIILWIHVGILFLGGGTPVPEVKPCKSPIPGCRVLIYPTKLEVIDMPMIVIGHKVPPVVDEEAPTVPFSRAEMEEKLLHPRGWSHAGGPTDQEESE
jgi:hypothetical protein